MKKYFIFLCLVCVQILNLAGCSNEGTEISSNTDQETAVIEETTTLPEPTAIPQPTAVVPLSLINRAQAEMAKVQTSSWVIRATDSANEGEDLIALAVNEESCSFQAPETVYCHIAEVEKLIGTPSEVPIEYVIQGEVIWTRQGGPWWEDDNQNLEYGFTVGLFFLENGQFGTNISELLIDAQLNEVSTRDDLPFHIIDVAFDSEKIYLALVPSNAEFLLDIPNVERRNVGQIWVGKDDSLIHKMAIELTTTTGDLVATLEFEIEFTQFNQPVDILDPESG